MLLLGPILAMACFSPAKAAVPGAPYIYAYIDMIYTHACSMHKLCRFVTNPTLLCAQDAIFWRRCFHVCLRASFSSVFCM